MYYWLLMFCVTGYHETSCIQPTYFETREKCLFASEQMKKTASRVEKHTARSAATCVRFTKE